MNIFIYQSLFLILIIYNQLFHFFYRTIRSSKGSKNHERQRARTARKVFSLVRLHQTSHKGIFYLCDT